MSESLTGLWGRLAPFVHSTPGKVLPASPMARYFAASIGMAMSVPSACTRIPWASS